jgi:hypothetical protein
LVVEDALPELVELRSLLEVQEEQQMWVMMMMMVQYFHREVSVLG